MSLSRIILKTVFVVPLICVALTALGLFRLNRAWDFSLPADTHAIIIGNSTGASAIDDDLLPGYDNVCRLGTHFIHLAPMLERLLDANPQIDTVMIVCGLADMVCFMDDELFRGRDIQSMRDVSDLISIAPLDALVDFLGNPHLLPYVLTSGVDSFFSRPSLGGYYELDYHKLEYGCFWRSGVDYLEWSLLSGAKDKKSLADMRESHSLQVKWLGAMVDACRARGKDCVILMVPVYRLDDYFDECGYLELLASLDCPEISVADYSHFELPDSACYADIYHLHRSGADIFSRHLRDFGILSVPVSDYIYSKTASLRTNP